jgi:hypothetical protein
MEVRLKRSLLGPAIVCPLSTKEPVSSIDHFPEKETVDKTNFDRSNVVENV